MGSDTEFGPEYNDNVEVKSFVAVEETNIRVSCLLWWSEIVRNEKGKRMKWLGQNKIKWNWEKRVEFCKYS